MRELLGCVLLRTITIISQVTPCQSWIRCCVNKTSPDYEQHSLELLPGLEVVLIRLGGRVCQYGRNVIYTTSIYVPEHIYPCGPGAQIASSPEDVHVYVCLHIRVCVCGGAGRSCEYNGKWFLGLPGHGSRSLGLSTVISSRMVITYCKNKHHYLLPLPLFYCNLNSKKSSEPSKTCGTEKQQKQRLLRHLRNKKKNILVHDFKK